MCATEVHHTLLHICWELQGEAYSVNTLCMLLERGELLDVPADREEINLFVTDLFVRLKL